MSDYAFLPLVSRSGEVIAHALVDAADLPRLSQWSWNLGDRGRYASRLEGRDRIRLHRLLLGLSPGDGLQTDHINRNGLDNRRSNLRVVPHWANMQNRRSWGKSGYRGVWWDRGKGRWRAEAKVCGHRFSIGSFKTAEEADRAAAAWRALHMPFSDDARTERQAA